MRLKERVWEDLRKSFWMHCTVHLETLNILLYQLVPLITYSTYLSIVVSAQTSITPERVPSPLFSCVSLCLMEKCCYSQINGISHAFLHRPVNYAACVLASRQLTVAFSQAVSLQHLIFCFPVPAQSRCAPGGAINTPSSPLICLSTVFDEGHIPFHIEMKSVGNGWCGWVNLLETFLMNLFHWFCFIVLFLLFVFFPLFLLGQMEIYCLYPLMADWSFISACTIVDFSSLSPIMGLNPAANSGECGHPWFSSKTE